ncbi:MAG: WYL domain-containing protein, partial [Clostridiales bacterium]|nr:WYL domain-containing protein [Clostridiales bacterium]
LKGLGSVSKSKDIEMLLHKFAPREKSIINDDGCIVIDLASHHKHSLSDKIEQIKRAINQSKVINFTYYSKAGQHPREIEPYIITFKWSDWYVVGYCLHKNDFRMFKLNRLWDLHDTDKTFNKRIIPEEKQDYDAHFTDDNPYEVVFDPSVKYLIVEMYGPNCYEETEDGKLHFRSQYTNRDYIIQWILGFGDKARVVFPLDLAEEIRMQAENIAKDIKHDI